MGLKWDKLVTSWCWNFKCIVGRMYFVLLHSRRLLSFLDGCWIMLDLVPNPKSSKKSLRKLRCSTTLFYLQSTCPNGWSRKQWPQVFLQRNFRKGKIQQFSSLTSCFHLAIPHPQRRFAWEESRSAAGRGGRRARGGLGSTDAAGRGGGERCGELQRDGVGSQTWGWCERSVMDAE